MRNLKTLILLPFFILLACTTMEVKHEIIIEKEAMIEPLKFPDVSAYIDIPVYVYQNLPSGERTGLADVQILVDGTESRRTDGEGWARITIPSWGTELFFMKKGYLDKQITVHRSLEGLGLKLNLEPGDQTDGIGYDIQATGRMKDSSEVSVVIDGSMGGPSKGSGP